MEERKMNSLYCRTCSVKEPFRIHISLYFKAALCANSFFKKISFHSYRRKELMTPKKTSFLDSLWKRDWVELQIIHTWPCWGISKQFGWFLTTEKLTINHLFVNTHSWLFWRKYNTPSSLRDLASSGLGDPRASSSTWRVLFFNSLKSTWKDESIVTWAKTAFSYVTSVHADSMTPTKNTAKLCQILS